MIDWLEEFYTSPETRQLLEESYAPLFTELGTAVAGAAGKEVGVAAPAVGAFVQSMLQSYVNRYMDSSRAQLQELVGGDDPSEAIAQRLAEWGEKRPGKVAAQETFKTANAVTETVYKDAGVTRKRWNSRGKSCPYCKRMDGKVVGIDRPFHREGDAIEVPDSEIAAKAKLNFTHEIGHPPQHAGCDCVIEADMTSQVTDEEREQPVYFVADIPLQGIPAGQPHTDSIEYTGWGLKRGAVEREAQMRKLVADDRILGGKPAELLAIDGNMAEARETWAFSWQDGSDNPSSAMAARVLSESRGTSGAIWSKGQALMEPSPAMRQLTDNIYDTTQAGLKQDTYKLYRGVGTRDGSGNVLESWTTDPEIANRFDGYAVYEAEVPKSRVFLDLSTGSEAEMVVMGGADLPSIRVYRQGADFVE